MTLGVNDLSAKSEAATRLANAGSAGDALVAYLACVMAACRELLQARGLAQFLASAPDAKTRLCQEVGQVVDLARYCLDQSHALLRAELAPTSPRQSSPSLPCSATAAVTANPTPSHPPPLTMGSRTLSPLRTLLAAPQPATTATPASAPASPMQPPPPPLSASMSSLPPVVQFPSAPLQQQQQHQRPDTLARTHSGNFAALGGSGASGAPPAEPVVLPLGLELVPGIDIDRWQAELLRKLDTATIARISEPARELQILNQFLARKHQANLAKAASASTAQFARQQAISDVVCITYTSFQSISYITFLSISVYI